ncbi:hypothetical protein MOJ78_13535 [Alkalihalobacillus sp. AL-G]|nr:hypothetical protein MOJ78_13535 [Alkalihalobacillus sp. AL-G]
MLEMMMVLSILVVLTGVVFINLYSIKTNRELDQFIQLLTSDLHYAQQYALAEQVPVEVKFNNTKMQYIIRTGPSKIIKQVEYPDNVYFEEGTTSLSISYNNNGTIREGGTLLLRSKEETYKIVFHLGKGRFYIEQL